MIAEFPLFVFTLLGGAAAGAYVFAAFFPAKEVEGKKKAVFPLVVLILLAVSGLMLLTHLGHPERMFNAFSNPTAGITQEGVTMMGLGLFALIDLILAFFKGKTSRPVQIVAAIFGFLLLCAMANAYFQMLGIAACNTAAVIPFFLIGGLSLGAALYALFMDEPYKKGTFSLVSIIVAALLAITLIAMTAHFASIGESPVAMACGLVIAPIASIVVMAVAQKGGKTWAPATVLALMVIGMAIARYSFYALV